MVFDKAKAKFQEKVVAPQQATAAIAVVALCIGVIALYISVSKKGGK